MCDRLPPTALPPSGAPLPGVPLPGVPPTSVPPTSVPPTSVPPTSVPPTSEPLLRLGLPRRTVVTGLGALLLTACARPRGPRPVACAPSPELAHPRQTQQAAGKRSAYRIVARGEWGAEPLKANHDPMARITRITLHHTATLPEMEARNDRDLVLGVQNFHRNTRGWADIGYHWLIGLDGNVYEGRALDVQGAHAGGGNNVENLGISVIGNFTQGLPKEPQLKTVERFLSAQMTRYRVPADQVFGHRDLKPTECPGAALYTWLTSFKQARL